MRDDFQTVVNSLINLFTTVIAVSGLVLAPSHALASDPMSAFDVRPILQYSPPDIAELFKLSAEGRIIDGPRRGPGEPVDFTQVLGLDGLAYAFTGAVLECSSGIRDCSTRIFRWDSKELSYRILEEAGTLDVIDLEAIAYIFNTVLAPLGFSMAPAADEKSADVVFVAGSQVFLRAEARQFGDPFATSYFAPQISVADSPSGSCYTSTSRRNRGGQARVFFQPGDYKKCLPQQLSVLVGLNETDGLFPSIAGEHLEYRAATLLDIMYSRVLYHDDFPIEGNPYEIMQFFKSVIGPQFFTDF
jgi:hypothetical protein